MTLHVDLHGRGAAADARQAARNFFASHTCADEPLPPVDLDAAVLLISELVTNALRHTSGGCALDLDVRPEGIDIAVTDTSSAEPQPRRIDQQAEGGWGWHLVNRLGTDVRILHHPSGGKTIHVRVPH
ncbi:ATP-binding protein [Streptomyces sp. NPDC060048]|uniref:ATP-binding protein n=1 Tax=unclassified Streptomyces TaxID=2593676 RepID=UPI0036B98E03